jgi:hypothetical protein
MKSYLMFIGLEVWTIVKKGYDVPKATLVEAEDNKKIWEHAKALNTLQTGLSKKILAKVLNCNNAKQFWDKLETIYVGDSKVKRAKLQTLRVQYEGLKMKDEENISKYFERFDNIVNAIRGLGVEVSDNGLVEKVLRTLPILYNPKVSSLEDQENLDKITMDELYGILTTYELRLGHENLPQGEAAFKVLKKTKIQNKKPQSIHHEESDVEEDNFITKLQKGEGKYKGKLSFKCFNCGKVGHFAAKCPYPKEDLEYEENKTKQYKKKEKPNYKKKIYKGKNNFYSKEENISSSEASDSDESDDDEVLFLCIEESNEIDEIKHEKELEDEAKVNMDEELLSALDELRKYKTRYRQLKSFVFEQKEKHEQK